VVGFSPAKILYVDTASTRAWRGAEKSSRPRPLLAIVSSHHFAMTTVVPAVPAAIAASRWFLSFPEIAF